MSAHVRRCVGRVALAIFLGSLGAPLFALLHLALDDDPACGSSGLGPRHAVSQFETSRQAAETGHCAVCHWMRAVTDRGLSASYVVRIALTPERLSPPVPNVWDVQASFVQLSPRAPPATASV